jgi:hypothetical protein
MTQFRGMDPIFEDNWLVAKVKRNPEAFLVLAAGCALLLRSAGSSPRQTAHYSDGRWSDESRWSRSASDIRERVKDTATAVSEKASSYATSLSDTTGAMSERAADYATSLSDQASEWGRNAAEQANRMGAHARSSIEDGMGRMLREQPFNVAAFGVAVGAAVAALLPPTEVEQQALRPLRGAATAAVSAATENVRDAVAATGSQLKESAERRGLSAEGIKGLAREATETFTETLSGKSGDQAHASSPRSGV